MAQALASDPMLGPLAKVPPQNTEAEEAVLASVLMDADALAVCLEHLTADDFYQESHRLIFLAMAELGDRGQVPDMIAVNNHLEAKGWLDRVGGSSRIAGLVDGATLAANIETYARVVKEKSLLRGIVRASSETITDVFTSADVVSEIVDRAEQRLFAVAGERDRRAFLSVGDLVIPAYKHVEFLFENRGKLKGLTTGFKDLDDLTGGLQKADLFVVAGRPSMGKTAFALNMAVNASRAGECIVAVFSLEMSREQLMMRLLTSEARLDASRVGKGELGESDWPRLQKAAGTLSELRVFIDDQPSMSTFEIRGKARRLAKQHGLGLVIVDYLQLMRGVTNISSREQEISEISRSLKALAKELQVPVVALSQLNRMVEGRDNKRPRLSDLRESGAIEQDADVIAFVYRDEVYNPETPDRNIAEIIVGKHRNGPVGTVKLAFLKEFTRFDDLAYDPYASAPEGGPGPYEADNLP